MRPTRELESYLPDMKMNDDFSVLAQFLENPLDSDLWSTSDAENEQADTRREQFLLREVPGMPNKQSDLVTAEVKQEVGGTIV